MGEDIVVSLYQFFTRGEQERKEVVGAEIMVGKKCPRINRQENGEKCDGREGGWIDRGLREARRLDVKLVCHLP